MTTPSNQSSTEGTAISGFSLSACGSGLSFFAEGLPPGIVINPRSGAISGTPAVGDATDSPYTVTVITTDGTNFAQESFQWTISSPVTLSPIADQTSTENGTFTLGVSGSYAAYTSVGQQSCSCCCNCCLSASSGSLVYTATGLPPGLAINTSTGTITGTLAVGDAANNPYGVTVIANNGPYSAWQTFTLTVNCPITFTSVPTDQNNVEGDDITPLSLSVQATESLGHTITYSASGLPCGLEINPSSGAISGTIAAGAANYSPYSVTVTATDGTYSSNQVFDWVVANPISITIPPDQFSIGGNPIDVVQIKATSSVSGPLTFQATGLPAHLTMSTSGEISGTVEDLETATGESTVTITVCCGPYSNTVSFTWTVLSQSFSFVSADDDGQLLQERKDQQFDYCRQGGYRQRNQLQRNHKIPYGIATEPK